MNPSHASQSAGLIAAASCARISARSRIACPSASAFAAQVTSLALLRRSSHATPARHDRPFRMAVIGSGPAGFYTSYRVMALIPDARVDMYEALPVPFGLVRFGVAPDHPEVKNCEEKFTEVASSPNFTFIGNTAIGHAPHHPNGQCIPLRTLLHHYDAVLFAYGASKDRQLAVRGESTLRRIYSAREFVGWYNGLPEFANLNPDLSSLPSTSDGDDGTALIIGQGNVALDIARILLEDIDKLRRTDIAEYALQALSESRIRHVTVVGRRAPMQAAFTIKELRELMNLPGVGFHPVQRHLVPENVATLPRARRRLMEVLLKGSKTPLTDAAKSWDLRFCLSPVEFRSHATEQDAVGATVFERNVLSDLHDPGAKVLEQTKERETIGSSVVFRSIGYKSEAISEFRELGIAFDERKGTVANDGVHGRVVPAVGDGGAVEQQSQKHFPGLYCAGWVKRGPTGVIASTMEDAFATAGAIAADWQAGEKFLGDSLGNAPNGRRDTESAAGWEGVKSELGVVNGKVFTDCAVDWDGWLAIDRAEKQMGKQHGKQRLKFTAIEEMLSASKARS